MWEIVDSDDKDYHKALKRFGDNCPLESAQLFDRLHQLCVCLNSGLPLRATLTRGWVHHKYKLDMKSIDGGGGKGRASLRLYIYPDTGNQNMVILYLGDKSSQDNDVKKAYVALEAYLAEMADGEQDEIQKI